MDAEVAYLRRINCSSKCSFAKTIWSYWRTNQLKHCYVQTPVYPQSVLLNSICPLGWKTSDDSYIFHYLKTVSKLSINFFSIQCIHAIMKSVNVTSRCLRHSKWDSRIINANDLMLQSTHYCYSIVFRLLYGPGSNRTFAWGHRAVTTILRDHKGLDLLHIRKYLFPR